MAGSALAAGIGSVAAVLVLGLAASGAAAVESQRVAGVADAAALAAADTVSGAIAGDPCARASEVAAAQRATLAGCSLDGLIATVSVASTFVGLPVRATARAGPPP
ncbi:Rv3654c family TadE-like protein [Microbacterium marinilacus]|uniref:Helicase n=1 Tax=Microbacterium marinilacus TaxID=415209 RepID=A0ABP7BFH0_9MICO|nr:Rv3654c family TadE-like protein [Microbacterium marinilacus]MBY0689028.1 helicase [Microbacterium marinilacus]